MSPLSEEEKQKIVEEERLRAQARANYQSKQPAKVSTGMGCFIILALVIGIPMVISIGSNKSSTTPTVSTSPTPTDSPDKRHTSEARACAQLRVEQALKAPSTAKFGGCALGSCVKPLGKDKYTVSAYVDSQNSFGANIRTNYICQVTVTDPENVLCTTSCSF